MFKESDQIEKFEPKVWLSSPTMHGEEFEFLKEAYETNWMSTVGANINEVERLVCKKIGCKYAVGLSAGTAALHMAVKLAGVKPGEKVFCSDMTFSATVNPIVYEGGVPVFIDTEYDTWNMDPEALEKAFELYPDVKVVVIAHLYGTPGKVDELRDICEKHGAVIIEDAAESMGATYKGLQTGTFGKYNAISFNGNKIITGSSGGMLLTDDKEAAEKVRKWSTQSREAAPWYQHEEIGYNYRMSNVIAGVVRGQMPHLEEHIAQKKVIYDDAVMLRQLLKALRYSDPECLRELSGYNNEENYSEEKIEYLIRYVKTLLALSVNAFSLNPPKKVKQKKLTEYLHEIAYPLTDQDTVEILKRVEEDLSLQNRQEYRSAWHIYLHENEKGEKAEYAEAVLDLCYNLTMEDSIYGISKHYDPNDIESCREWFKSKLKDYWEKEIAPSHVFPAKDSTTWELYQGKLPDWRCAIRILQMKNVQKTLELKPALENEKLQTGSRYEVGMEKELKEWDKSIHKGIKRNIIDALIGVVIFVGIELGMNYLQDIVSVEEELSLAATIGWAVLQVIAFGILSSWISGMISRWWTSCDILDSIEELTRTWADLKIVRKCRERLKVEKG